MNTLLYEMAHAVLMIFDCDCPACNHKVSRANAEGLDGHGPVWRKLAQAIEREANLSLERVGHSWNMDVHVGGVLHQGVVEAIVRAGRMSAPNGPGRGDGVPGSSHLNFFH